MNLHTFLIYSDLTANNHHIKINIRTISVQNSSKLFILARNILQILPMTMVWNQCVLNPEITKFQHDRGTACQWHVALFRFGNNNSTTGRILTKIYDDSRFLPSPGLARGDAVDEVARAHNQDPKEGVEAGHEVFSRKWVPCHLYLRVLPRKENQIRQQ